MEPKKIFYETIIKTTSWQKGELFIQKVCGNVFSQEEQSTENWCAQSAPLHPNQKILPKKNEINTTTVELYPDTRGHHYHIQQQQHETCSPQWCKLPEQTKIKKLIRQSLIFIQQSNNTTKQRLDYQHCLNNQTRHDIINGSQTSGTIHHGTRGSIHHNNTGRNET